MNLPFRLYQIRTVGWRISAAKAIRSMRLRVFASDRNNLLSDRETFTSRDADLPEIIFPALNLPNSADILPHADELRETAKRALNAELWLPGHGWKSHAHGASCPGMEKFHYTPETTNGEIDSAGEWMDRLINGANISEARRRWLLIQQPYVAIDWQCDQRSGFTWSEGVPSRATRAQPGPGVDPKNPWDVSRMHHLLHCAMAYGVESDRQKREDYANLIRSRIIDFVATNPPGYGINWTVPMEVAIRIANILVAVHLLKLHGVMPDSDFLETLSLTCSEHASWVLDNFEWSEGMRGNHFLSNLAGLSVCAMYLSQGNLRSRIEEFLEKYLDDEILYQFHSDGSHFEASLPYHFFSAEMVSWCYLSASLRNVKATRPKKVQERLEAVHTFSLNMLSANSAAPQIGDNDGGHFLPFLPFHHTDTNPIRPSQRANIVALVGVAAQAQINDEHIVKKSTEDTHATSVLQSIYRSEFHSEDRSNILPSASSEVLNGNRSEVFRADDFGIVAYHKNHYDCYLRAGSIGQHGRGGHSHNDQLSLVLTVHGIEFFTDPGTYTYTALPVERNNFRNTAAHSTLSVAGKEQQTLPANLSEGLFWVQSNKAHARTLLAERNEWQGSHRGFGAPHKRVVRFMEHEILTRDECDISGEKRIAVVCHPDVRIERESNRSVLCIRNATKLRVESNCEDIGVESAWYSPEYGVKVPTNKLMMIMNGSTHELRCTIVEK